MADLNLSSISIYVAGNYVKQNWIRAANTNFFYKHILARGACLVLAPASIIVQALDIIIGLGAGAATVATLGIEPHTARFASRQLFNPTNNILAVSYWSLLNTINPTAKAIQHRGPGIVTPLAKRPLKNLANGFKRSDHLLTRHVASRLTYALTGLAMVITRVADAIIGLIAAPLSFLTLGLVAPINSAALFGLQAPGVVNDLFYCMMKTINPWSSVRC